MIVIGVTGGFATGKSTVTDFFLELGAKVIDADKIAHNIIRRDSPAFQKIVLSFGESILSKNKSIDRRKLGLEVFGDKNALRLLCRITHPLIINRIKQRLRDAKRTNPRQIVVIDAPLLIEAGLEKIVDRILVVDVTSFNQIQRGITKCGQSRAEVKKIIGAQLPLTVKKRKADYVVDNNSTLLKTKKQVERVWRELNKKKKNGAGRITKGRKRGGENG